MVSSSNRISVCALVPYPLGTTPSQRFRIEQWLPHLSELGVDVEIVPFADERLIRLLKQPARRAAKAAALSAAFLRSAGRVGEAVGYDVILIHRAVCIAGPAWIERALARTRKPIVFDFDDAIYRLHTSAENRAFGWLKFPGKTAAICRLSRHVVVGNAHLAEYAARYNANVTVVPSSVDTDRFRPPAPRAAGGRLVVGWTGSSTSQTYLEWFAPVLRDLLAHRDFELRVHSDREPDLPGIPYVWRPWSPETEAEEIAGFDVGIMPMPDDPWALGKCAMKALLYMATGVPPLCSAVGANREVVRHGENGFLATTPAEWLARLADLADDPALRARLGAEARRTAVTDFSASHCAGQLARVIRGVAGIPDAGGQVAVAAPCAGGSLPIGPGFP